VWVSTEDGWWLLRAQHPTRAAAPCEAADEAGLERLKSELKVVLAASGVEFIDERRAPLTHFFFGTLLDPDVGAQRRVDHRRLTSLYGRSVRF
jgi:hypothetical protein